MTDELTEARVRAALKMIDGQAAAWRRYEVDDTADECETLAALARAWLDSAAAPPASPWRPITPGSEPAGNVVVKTEYGYAAVKWEHDAWWLLHKGFALLHHPPTHWKPLDEPPTEAGR